LKPPKFAYHAPGSVEEAIQLLQSYAGNARILAGGQSLVPLLNFRLLAPQALVDLRKVPGLADIRYSQGKVCIGAMTRQRAAETSPVVAQHLPIMIEALGWVGHLPTRSRGTIGGSIAHADPSAELPMVLLALDGEVCAQGSSGTRVIAADDLFDSVFTTKLAPGEILSEVRMPAMQARAGFAVEEYARRKGDFAIVAVLLQAGLHALGRPAWASALNIVFFGALVLALVNAQQVMHPASPIISSPSSEIRAYFAVLVGLCMLTGWQLARWFQRASA